MTQTDYLDFDAGDGSLYEHGEDGQITHIFTADPECELETFEEFTARAERICKATNSHSLLVELLQDILNHIQDGGALRLNSRIFQEDSPASIVIKEALASAGASQ